MNAVLSPAAKSYKATPIEWRAGGREVEAPRELQTAAAALCELADDENGMIDALTNDVAANYRVLTAHVATCRAALDKIEAMARGRLQVEAVSYREQLQSIEALGVPLGMEADADADIFGDANSEANANSSYFGACPVCGESGTVLNIGREHWFVCHDHKIKWHVGSNLFSAWKEENQETWDKNAETLSGYREVEPTRGA
jgi:hypothetical protein